MSIDDVKAWIIATGVVGTCIVGAAYGDAYLSGSMLFIIVIVGICDIVTRS